MFLEFTDDDLLILEKQRLDRFRASLGESMVRCFLHLNEANTLAIHCLEPWMVDQLLYNLDALQAAAWVIVGAFQIRIYFAQEEVFTAPTQFPSADWNPAQNSAPAA